MKTIVFHLEMPFDVRQFIHTGIIQRIAKKHKVVLLVRPHFVPLLQPILADHAVCLPMHYWKQGNPRKYFSAYARLKCFLNDFFAESFRYTYAHPRLKRNRTRTIHILNALKKVAENPFRNHFLFTITAIVFSFLLSYLPAIRRLCRRVFASFVTPDRYRRFFDEWKPYLAVTCSYSLDWDALFMSEARKNHVPIFTAIQSWDKTSSKGSPRVIPDYVSVWNEIMKNESRIWHEIDEDNIFLSGVPEWDHYFENEAEKDRTSICRSYGLDSVSKVVYVGLCSPSYHRGNINLIRFFLYALINNRFNRKVNLYVRVHPFYFFDVSAKKKNELLSELELLKAEPGVFIDYPETYSEDNSITINEIYFKKLKEVFLISDVNICILSTQMIEACIFDKPVVSLNYGIWSTVLYDTLLRKIKFEHLHQIYKTGAVLLTHSEKELIEHINRSLANPSLLRAERKRLVDEQIPVNRGNASINLADHIASLVESI